MRSPWRPRSRGTVSSGGGGMRTDTQRDHVRMWGGDGVHTPRRDQPCPRLHVGRPASKTCRSTSTAGVLGRPRRRRELQQLQGNGAPGLALRSPRCPGLGAQGGHLPAPEASRHTPRPASPRLGTPPPGATFASSSRPAKCTAKAAGRGPSSERREAPDGAAGCASPPSPSPSAASPRTQPRSV